MPLKPDPTFYPSPSSAIEGPPEELAYVVTLNTPQNGEAKPDALTVVDVKDGSSTKGQTIGRLDMPNVGDELHHFGWNACSSALCPWAPHPHVERRYLVVPGLRSSVAPETEADIVQDPRKRLGRWSDYDISRLRDELGWTPRPIREALQSYVAWLRENEFGTA